MALMPSYTNYTLVPAADREARVLHEGRVQAEALHVLVANQRLLKVRVRQVGTREVRSRDHRVREHLPDANTAPMGSDGV
eukprot:1960381-Pyramimonas_sp.AAC.1